MSLWLTFPSDNPSHLKLCIFGTVKVYAFGPPFVLLSRYSVQCVDRLAELKSGLVASESECENGQGCDHQRRATQRITALSFCPRPHSW